jgi:hypothetical protein
MRVTGAKLRAWSHFWLGATRRGTIHAVCEPGENLDDLSSAQLRELVVTLLEKVSTLEQLIVEQRGEIARLKGPPDIKPSGMDKTTEPPKPDRQGNRPRRGKIRLRVSIEDRVLKATAPAGSRFKGYETYLVQELVLSGRAIRYMRERWVTPDGRTIVAALPEGTCEHFGPGLRRFVLMQYHQGQSTLPRLTALLHSVGVSISKREVQRLLTEKQQDFLDEAREVLRVGLETSPWISVDDTFAFGWRTPSVSECGTGARHKAQNGFSGVSLASAKANRNAWFARRSAMTGSPGSPRAHPRPG